VLSDKLSRMNVLGDALIARQLLLGEEGVLCCKSHMSYGAYIFLQEGWLQS
jgi:hypothetical protein